MKYKAIFSDFDGTLYNDDFTISAQNKQAIKKYVANGGKVVVATGRLFRSIKPHLDNLGLKDGFVIVRQGGGIYDIASEKELFSYSFDKMSAVSIAKYLDSLKNVNVGFYFDDNCFTAAKSEYFDLFAKICDIKYTAVNMSLEKYITTSGILPTKFLCLASEKDCNAICEEGDKLFENQVDFAKSGKSIIEMMPKEVNKGKAVEQLSKTFGLSRDEIICIGDSENDISMIKYAGLGVAVSNAFEKTKSYAKFIAKSCNENAIEQIIEEFCLANE